MTPLLTGALVAGLVGSPHCVGMCGAFAVAASDSWGEALAWNVGRLTTYAFLGALAGALGHAIPGPSWLGPLIAGLFLVWFAAKLAGFDILPTPQIPSLVKLGRKLVGAKGVPGRYAFGIATGFLPCGLVYAALALPLSSGSAMTGALSMVLFGLGTVPVLAVAGAGLRRIVARSLAARRVLALLVLSVGLVTVYKTFGRDPTQAMHGDGGNCHETE